MWKTSIYHRQKLQRYHDVFCGFCSLLREAVSSSHEKMFPESPLKSAEKPIDPQLSPNGPCCDCSQALTGHPWGLLRLRNIKEFPFGLLLKRRKVVLFAAEWQKPAISRLTFESITLFGNTHSPCRSWRQTPDHHIGNNHIIASNWCSLVPDPFAQLILCYAWMSTFHDFKTKTVHIKTLETHWLYLLSHRRFALQQNPQYLSSSNPSIYIHLWLHWSFRLGLRHSCRGVTAGGGLRRRVHWLQQNAKTQCGAVHQHVAITLLRSETGRFFPEIWSFTWFLQYWLCDSLY